MIISSFYFQKETIFYQSTAWYHKDTFILNFFSSDVYDVNIEYVLNDNTVFEEHQKVIRPVLMEVSSATNASSSFNSYPCIEVYLNGACSVLDQYSFLPCPHLSTPVYICTSSTIGHIERVIILEKPLCRKFYNSWL